MLEDEIIGLFDVPLFLPFFSSPEPLAHGELL